MYNLPAKGYRTIGIDTQIPWPAQERIVCFRGRKFHLLPGSDALARMIRVQTCEGFTQVDDDKLILELLSALAWAEQAEAVTTFGNWCTAPLNIGKGPMGVGIRGSSRRSICERCSVGSNTGGPRAVRTRRCSSRKSMCRDGVRTRPHSFNAAAAGKFLGRFVEFRSGHSTV
jgi:hypothetical protein